eukprot:6178325-Pleurochrysis_carterae.AAC.6
MTSTLSKVGLYYVLLYPGTSALGVLELGLNMWEGPKLPRHVQRRVANPVAHRKRWLGAVLQQELHHVKPSNSSCLVQRGRVATVCDLHDFTPAVALDLDGAFVCKSSELPLDSARLGGPVYIVLGALGNEQLNGFCVHARIGACGTQDRHTMVVYEPGIGA